MTSKHRTISENQSESERKDYGLICILSAAIINQTDKHTKVNLQAERRDYKLILIASTVIKPTHRSDKVH